MKLFQRWRKSDTTEAKPEPVADTGAEGVKAEDAKADAVEVDAARVDVVSADAVKAQSVEEETTAAAVSEPGSGSLEQPVDPNPNPGGNTDLDAATGAATDTENSAAVTAFKVTPDSVPPESDVVSVTDNTETAISTVAAETSIAKVVPPSAEAAPNSVAPSEAATEETSFYSRLKQGLSRTGGQLASGLGQLFLGKKVIDDELLEELESQLLMADIGIEATQRIIADITARVSRRELNDGDAVLAATRAALLTIIQPCEQPLDITGKKPFVILVVGVNGAGKTTTIGKLAHHYQAAGKKVLLAAGDTFRAAAVEQLQVWGERNNVPVIAQHTGADSASVLFDALQAAQSRDVDVLIADTAGRLQNKAHLMDELSKVVRVIRKLDPSAPHETLLVLDAGTGQNAVAQADEFDRAVGVTGIALTKLDGTARGGVIFAIAQKLQRPIRYVGVGESINDLRPFKATDFVQALFDQGDRPKA